MKKILGAAGLVASATLGVLMATRKGSQDDNPAQLEPTITYQIKRWVDDRWGWTVDRQTGVRYESYLGPGWVGLNSMYLFGKDGQGGSNRVGDDLKEIERLTNGRSFDFIESEEDARAAMLLINRWIPDIYQVFRTTTYVEKLA